MNCKIFGLSLLSLLCSSLVSCNNEPEPEPLPSKDKIEISVYSYEPAPGQFINEMPSISAGLSQDKIKELVTDEILRGHLVSLGSFGGSIIYHLSKPYSDEAGPDFRITGNAYETGRSGDGRIYGSSEPGIVYVMADSNSNGIPDDGEWFELRGECSDNAPVLTVRYTELADGSVQAQWTDPSDNSIRTLLNPRLSSHNHSYFPLWVSGSTSGMEFTGRMLPANGFTGEDGLFHQWLLEGYADSQPNDSPLSAFDISSACDKSGKKAGITSISFIKVVSGVLQVNGPLGECSTEVGLVELLHEQK